MASLVTTHNISGELATVLISPNVGGGGISSMSIANTHASDDMIVDLYIHTLSKAGAEATSYYIVKGKLVQKGETLTLNSPAIRFDNSDPEGDGLYIKLGASTSTADVIISL